MACSALTTSSGYSFNMAGPSLIPSGDFRTSYAADTTIFPTTMSLNFAIVVIILVGFHGQISIGHAAFFLLGAFSSAYINNNFPITVFFAIPLAGVVTALVG